MLLKGVFDVDIVAASSDIKHVRNVQAGVLTLSGQHRLQVPQAAGDEGGVERREVVVLVPGDEHLQHGAPCGLAVHHVLGDPCQLCTEGGKSGHPHWLVTLLKMFTSNNSSQGI